MSFIFLRHGDYHQPHQVPSAQLPYPLTDLGKDQAKLGGQKILNFLHKNGATLNSTIHCSSSLRAYQSARIIHNQLHLTLQLQEHHELNERRLGPLANLRVDEIERILEKDDRYSKAPKGWKSDRHYCLPYLGCESMAMAGKRVAQIILECIRKDCWTIFVGHGASFRHAAYELGILPEAEIPKLSMYHAEPLFFERQNTGFKLIEGTWKNRERREKAD